MSADKRAIKKKIETAIIILSAVSIVSLTVWTIYTVLDYMSTKMVYDLNEQEYAAICGEYLLDPQTADIEYIFFAGRDYWGVRLLLSENDLEDMNVLFTERVFDDERSDYFKIKEKLSSYVSNKVSDGTLREMYGLNFSETSPEHIKWYIDCCVFEADGKYYMEMNKQDTDNTEIYCKNIRSCKNGYNKRKQYGNF